MEDLHRNMNRVNAYPNTPTTLLLHSIYYDYMQYAVSITANITAHCSYVMVNIDIYLQHGVAVAATNYLTFISFHFFPTKFLVREGHRNRTQKHRVSYLSKFDSYCIFYNRAIGAQILQLCIFHILKTPK